MTTNSVLKAIEVSKFYGQGHTQVAAVNNVSLEIGAGELVLVMGPSGSGKTTLISMLGALLTPSTGTIFIGHTEITAMGESGLPEIRARNVGFVFQAFNLLDALTVEENILFPANLAPGGKAGAKPRAKALIDRLGLSKRQYALPATLSGGEKQRVAIARALINEPPLILADEPTGNLDSQSGQDVMMVLHDIARDEGKSVLLVTHDPRVEDIADRVLWLEDGRLSDREASRAHWTHCPVCNMRVDEWTAKYSVANKGGKLSFCSESCLNRFTQDPTKYQ